jgi:hypothetical protein
VAKLVARLLATAALWVRIQDNSQKYKKGDISKGVANTLWTRQKDIQKRKKFDCVVDFKFMTKGELFIIIFY